MATDRLARGGILVVGGGYAGSIVARRLGECTIVNPENYMLFRPLLAEAASGTIEPRHVTIPAQIDGPRAEINQRLRHAPVQRQLDNTLRVDELADSARTATERPPRRGAHRRKIIHSMVRTIRPKTGKRPTI